MEFGSQIIRLIYPSVCVAKGIFAGALLLAHRDGRWIGRAELLVQDVGALDDSHELRKAFAEIVLLKKRCL